MASANIFYDQPDITKGFVQNVNNNNSAFNLLGSGTAQNSTSSRNLFRCSSTQNNRIVYTGKESRIFQIYGSISTRGNYGVGDYYAFYVRKNGTLSLLETASLMRVNSTTDISSSSISGTVKLNPGDFIELWGQRVSGSTYNSTITIFSLNLSIK